MESLTVSGKIKSNKYGVSRIDQGGATTWFVRIGINNVICPYTCKSFRSTRYGGIKKALKAAEDFVDETFKKYNIDLDKSRPRYRGDHST